MKMRTADLGASLILIAMCVLGFLETRNFTEQAALLPRITFGCIAFLSALQLGKVVGKKTDKTVSFQWKRVLIIMALSAGYVLLIPVAGYYVSTVLYIFFGMFLYGIRNKVLLCSIPVGFCLFVYLVFVRVLSLNPPAPFFMS